MRECIGGRERLAERFCDASGEIGCAFYRDLLAKDCAHGKFEAIPAAGNAESWLGAETRGELRVAAEAARDGGPVGIEIEHRADALDYGEQSARFGNLDTHDEGVPVFIWRDFEMTLAPIQKNRSAITVPVNQFDAGR